MKTEIHKLVTMLAAKDPSIKPENLEKALAFLNRKEDPIHDPYRVIPYKDVVRMLGMKRLSIEILIQRGYLERGHVPGRKYAIGVTRESYRRFTERPVVIRPCPRPLKKHRP